ncbi:hypothetical protein NPIL_570271 [Nephila pilipes]|uniref:Uncharacterized protein n=1 Tax=Nephila pilipes TaxID=299642 RepID=A0A8X6MXC9_NEPPI|nr:hypothetical protein NPIL_570271 [Nephila pilipes]
MTECMPDLVKAFLAQRESVKGMRVIFSNHLTILKILTDEKRLLLNMICEKYEDLWLGKEEFYNQMQAATTSMDQFIYLIEKELLIGVDKVIELYEGCMGRIKVWQKIHFEMEILKIKLNVLESMENRDEAAIDQAKVELSVWESEFRFSDSMREELSYYLDKRLSETIEISEIHVLMKNEFHRGSTARQAVANINSAFAILVATNATVAR